MTGHEPIKHAGDVGATVAAILVAVSHWASIITPIITMVIALLTLGWWLWRYVEKLRGKKETANDPIA